MTQNMSSLLLVVALSASADAYGRRRKVERTDKVDVRGGRETASVEDFDTTGVDIFEVEVFDASDFDARNRPSVEDFGAKESRKIGEENFWAPRSPKTKESTQRRPLGSWSSWSFFQRPNFNFPTRTRVKTTESPRSIRKSPMTMPDDFAVKRIVIFPCQDQNLRCKKTKQRKYLNFIISECSVHFF